MASVDVSYKSSLIRSAFQLCVNQITHFVKITFHNWSPFKLIPGTHGSLYILVSFPVLMPQQKSAFTISCVCMRLCQNHEAHWYSRAFKRVVPQQYFATRAFTHKQSFFTSISQPCFATGARFKSFIRRKPRPPQCCGWQILSHDLGGICVSLHQSPDKKFSCEYRGLCLPSLVTKKPNMR